MKQIIKYDVKQKVDMYTSLKFVDPFPLNFNEKHGYKNLQT